MGDGVKRLRHQIKTTWAWTTLTSTRVMYACFHWLRMSGVGYITSFKADFDEVKSRKQNILFATNICGRRPCRGVTTHRDWLTVVGVDMCIIVSERADTNISDTSFSDTTLTDSSLTHNPTDSVRIPMQVLKLPNRRKIRSKGWNPL